MFESQSRSGLLVSISNVLNSCIVLPLRPTIRSPWSCQVFDPGSRKPTIRLSMFTPLSKGSERAQNKLWGENRVAFTLKLVDFV